MVTERRLERARRPESPQERGVVAIGSAAYPRLSAISSRSASVLSQPRQGSVIDLP